MEKAANVCTLVCGSSDLCYMCIVRSQVWVTSRP